jgi:hypothetical protein
VAVGFPVAIPPCAGREKILAAHITSMETIYVLEAISHAAHDITTITNQAKDIRDFIRSLTACCIYLRALFNSRR